MDKYPDSERLEIIPDYTPRPDTWAASPVDIYFDDAVREQQRAVYDRLMERSKIAAELLELPDEVAEFMCVNTAQRFFYESKLNSDSFAKKIVPIQEAPMECLGAVSRSIEGNATPLDLLNVRSDLGMPSIELAKLSHIGGIQIEDLDTMRDATVYAIEQCGGVTYHGPEMDATLKAVTADILMVRPESEGSADEVSPDDWSISAISMRRKRRFGKLPDGTIVTEKSQFIVRTDPESGLPEEIINKVRDIKVTDSVNWKRELFAIEGLFESIEKALADDDYSIMIPTTSTIYASNPETCRLSEEVASKRRIIEQGLDYLEGQKRIAELAFQVGDIDQDTYDKKIKSLKDRGAVVREYSTMTYINSNEIE